MLSAVLDQMQQLAAGWKQEAARMLTISAPNQMADALGHCAAELEATVKQLARDTEHLTPEEWGAQFSERNRPSTQTIRAWCRSGRLPHKIGRNGGYLIQRDARPMGRAARAGRKAS